MKIKFLSILTLIITLLGPGLTTGATFSTDSICKWLLLHSLEFSEAELSKTELLGQVTSLPNIRFNGHVSGQHGGRLHVLERVGEHWASNWAPKESPQVVLGDVRTLPIILGAQAARFFSFFKIDDRHMLVPDPIEFSLAIRHLNKKLMAQGFKPIELVFSHAPTKVLDDEEASRQFAEEFTLPMAYSGYVAVHDLSFHTAAILFEDFLRVVQKSVRRQREFMLFLKSNLKIQPGMDYLDFYQFANTMLKVQVSLLDTYSGNLIFVANHIAKGRDELAAEDLSESIKGLLFDTRGRSVDEILKIIVTALVKKEMETNPLFTEVKRNAILHLLEQFLITHPHPKYAQSLSLDQELMVNAVKKRMREIKLALARP